MKKILLILLALTLLVGCNNNNQTNNTTNEEAAATNEATENVANASTGNVTEEVIEEINHDYIDAMGRTVTIETKPERVVALYASFGDLWYEAGGDLVGIIDSSTIPEQAADLPQVGKMSTPNVEAIIALEPDLIIVRAGYAKQEELINIFEASDINVYAANYNSFEETMITFNDFCMINEKPDLYESKGLSMKNDIEKLTADHSDFSYLLLFATSKSISTKDDNITARIVDDFGGVNITKDYQIADETTKQFSFEKILEANPEYIFVQTMGSVEDAKARLETDISSNPAWGSLTAVQEGKFVYLPKELFLYKPNMKYVESYQYILDILAQ